MINLVKVLPLLVITYLLSSCGSDKNSSQALAQKKPEASIVLNEDGKAVIAEGAPIYYSANEGVSLPNIITQFIPEGFVVMDTVNGDLNSDNIPDVLIVLKKQHEDTVTGYPGNISKRPLYILLGSADGTFVLGTKSNNLIYCLECGGAMGDPYLGIECKKGEFIIYHFGGSGWRWNMKHKYKYSASEQTWFLVEKSTNSYHSADHEKVHARLKGPKELGNQRLDMYDIYVEENHGEW